jgi:flagellar biogenesis protein FliO
MKLKKLLLVFLFFSASLGYSEDETPPPLPTQVAPSPEQMAPAPESAPTDQEPPAQESPAPLPSSKEMTNSYENAFVRMLVTLLGLVLLVFATFWILRRLGKGKFRMGSGSSINVIEKRALSPKSMLYIVQIGNKKVLISESQLEVRALTSLEELPETD